MRSCAWHGLLCLNQSRAHVVSRPPTQRNELAWFVCDLLIARSRVDSYPQKAAVRLHAVAAELRAFFPPMLIIPMLGCILPFTSTAATHLLSIGG